MSVGNQANGVPLQPAAPEKRGQLEARTQRLAGTGLLAAGGLLGARVDGVKAVDVSFEEKKAVVLYDDAKTNVEALTAATTNHGFPSSVIR